MRAGRLRKSNAFLTWRGLPILRSRNGRQDPLPILRVFPARLPRFHPDKKLGYRHGRLDLAQLARMSSEEVAKSGLLTGKLVWIKLKPGESFSEECDVSDFYDSTKPGQYRITADYSDPESTILIRSNTVEVTVSK